MSEGLEQELRPWIETFQSRSRLDLQSHWSCPYPDGALASALRHPWGGRHRPDWAARGLIIWPRGGQWWELRLALLCPPAWREAGLGGVTARLALRWWAEAAELRVDGELVCSGDLFDTACRWPLPPRWWQGLGVELQLRLRSPLHDDGALIESRLELEPAPGADPYGVLLASELELAALRLAAAPGTVVPTSRQEALRASLAAMAVAPRASAPAAAATAELRSLLQQLAPPGAVAIHLLGHAHLDLAWLWPVADTWQAAERTFTSALALIERFEELHFGHSTPALYAWVESQRPALFARLRQAMQQGRWEPLNGPWVESDCVLLGTASLWHQFREGQQYSRAAFPEWEHHLCWLPDSFGFAAGLPAVARSTGVRWFCTHKLAWNATTPFPHRLFRWRSRCGAELLALITAPIGTDGDPVAIERYRLSWQQVTGAAEALWLPGVGDHGGGPTAELLEQLRVWRQQPLAAPQRHGTLRGYLAGLEPHAPTLPVWRDELYLELHRGCATSRPDQKRHNRTLERLLREAELAAVLMAPAAAQASAEPPWRALLFQQFHDILPGTSIPEVFVQAEPQWRQARRRACAERDRALQAWLAGAAAPDRDAPGQLWWVVQLQPQRRQATVRLPAGRWTQAGQPLPQQPAPGGGVWLQVPPLRGIAALPLVRQRCQPLERGRRAVSTGSAFDDQAPVTAPVVVERLGPGEGRWRLTNGLVGLELGPGGLEQLVDAGGRTFLAAPVELCRWQDRGEFWDAWDLAGGYRDHPLPLEWQGGAELLEQGPLCARFRLRGRCGASQLVLEGRLLAATPWLELVVAVDWRQRHELLRLELPLAAAARRLAADTSGGVLERPARAQTVRERSRWEVPVISWCAAEADQAGLGVLLDGPQGVSLTPDRLGVSLLRAPTWPDPGADNGWQRLRVALLPCPQGWRRAAVPERARGFREPLWCRPAAARAGMGEAQPEPLPATPLEAWPPLEDGLQLVGFRVHREGASLHPEAILAVQNLTPCRRRLTLAPGWRWLERVDGLAQPLQVGSDPLSLRPWELAFWRLQRL